MHYVFGDCTLDTQRYELRRAGTRVPLRPKVFQVLVYLLEQRHRVVSRDEVLAQVWSTQCVGEETLTSCVKAARRAVGDCGRTQRVIRTVHGHGLRFVADVTVTDSSRAPCPTTALPAQSPVGPPPGMLVGRATELTTLHQWYATARQGQRQVGFVTGEAGIGKTALVEAFVAQVAAEGAVWIGHGQCSEQYGTGEAYLPVLEALGRLCRGADGAHFLAWLRQQAPSWLAQMPALLSDAERAAFQQRAWDVTQARMLRELTEALESLTAEQPLLLVLEDLHWSDGATLEWLAYVARRRDPARLLVLGTYRLGEARVMAQPLYAVTRELLVHGQGAELVLGALSATEVATYVTQRFGEGPLAAALIPVLIKRTQGNPLFLVTMVETLVQRGVLCTGATGWERAAALDPATIGVPETLRHLIEQQFERLAPAEQTLIEAASVAGVDFTAAAVAAGLGMAAEDVDIRCATLARQGQFVQPHGTATWPDGTVTGRYRFGHALYHEVVYTRVPPGCRTSLHQQIGRRLEAAYGPQAAEIAPELAEHFGRGHAVPQALHYLWHAVETAAQRAAPHAVVDLVQRALALLATQPETPGRARQELDLRLALGPAWMATKGTAAPEVEHTYTRALALCQEIGETPQLFPTLRGLSWFYRARGVLSTAREVEGQLYELAQRAANSTYLLEAHGALGQTLLFLGEYAAARTHLEQGIALADPAGQHIQALHSSAAPGVWCRAIMAWVLWCLGYPTQALRQSQEALAFAQTLAHPHSLAFAHYFAAWMHHHRREASAVQAQAEALLHLATTQGFPLHVGYGTFWRGWALAIQGEGGAGLTQMHEGVAAVAAVGLRLAQPHLLVRLAEATGHGGQVTEALGLLAEAQTMLEESGQGEFLAEAYRLRGELQLHQAVPDAVRAEACFQQALAIARRQQAKSWELRVAVSLSRLWQQQGKRAEAHALLAPVYGWFTEGFDTADLQEAQALLATLECEPLAPWRDFPLSPYARNGALLRSA